MKKMLMAAIVVAMGWMMTSCGSNSTPESVVEKAMSCMQDNDYAGYLDLVYFQDKDGSTAEEIRAEALPMLEEKGKESMEKLGGIKSWEILETTLSDDGKSGGVKVKIIYGDGSDNTSTMKVVQTEDGKWMLDSKK